MKVPNDTLLASWWAGGCLQLIAKREKDGLVKLEPSWFVITCHVPEMYTATQDIQFLIRNSASCEKCTSVASRLSKKRLSRS